MWGERKREIPRDPICPRLLCFQPKHRVGQPCPHPCLHPRAAEGRANPAPLHLSSSSSIWFLLNQPHKVERVYSPRATVCKEGEAKELF